MNSASEVKKAFGMPSTDTAHQYIFKSGEYGPVYQYWYRDRAGNYYRYTNAPEDNPDYDPFFGIPLMDPDQPLPEKNPEFFTPEGFKRSMAVPPQVKPERNERYNQNDSSNIWFESIKQDNDTVYIYLDADVKENIDLYVQNQLRVVDSGIPKFRKQSSELFASKQVKDRITGAILILIDQGFYDVEELTAASVGDLQFVDQSIILLGRKFVCDSNFFDFITSIVGNRSPQEPLFVFDTRNGRVPVGENYIYSVFAAMRLSPKFLLQWNATHLYSRIVNRMAFQQVPVEDVETEAFDELARVLTTRDDVNHLVDFRVKKTLAQNYSTDTFKSLVHLTTDDFGVAVIRSDLSDLREDEKDFSEWLQSTPLHDISEEPTTEEPSPPPPSEEEEEEQPSPESPEDGPEPPAIPPDEVPE